MFVKSGEEGIGEELGMAGREEDIVISLGLRFLNLREIYSAELGMDKALAFGAQQ